ncbi:MAG: radical SAM family heme chaperone HemW [Alphaproteobacteria bacterium]|nr:radical SAM family heme chaperone HemW [Alphaproteobacteria bacterium]MDP7603874.1 radical SAM family heme chaperone HemW [Alphaproteobacteria bacterium]HJP20622.1 radical SAM family heme chaperone HemW [Alphaproteobacteria bacterium]
MQPVSQNGRTDTDFAAYVHWPFCLAKCPYCDFNSHVAPGSGLSGTIDQERWQAAYLSELAYAWEQLPPVERRPLGSIFFGGGTPSLMVPATVAAVLDRLADMAGLADDIEITLEANPTSVEAGRFADFRAAGVNRLSLGIQALDDDALAALGRGHDAAEARAALALAQHTFARVSCDLIYARPGQTPAAWRSELGEALGLGSGHLSLYQLTAEPGTPFGRAAAAGQLALPEDSHAVALFDLTQELCAAAGMPAYEISNHARPGQRCRHNLNAWRYGDYLGLGPGAHGRLGRGSTRRASQRIAAPGAWLAAVEAQRHGGLAEKPLSQLDQVRELLLLGLRLDEGILPARFQERIGRPLEEWVPAIKRQPLVDDGLLVDDAEGLRTTVRGRRLLDAVIAELAP